MTRNSSSTVALATLSRKAPSRSTNSCGMAEPVTAGRTRSLPSDCCAEARSPFFDPDRRRRLVVADHDRVRRRILSMRFPAPRSKRESRSVGRLVEQQQERRLRRANTQAGPRAAARRRRAWPRFAAPPVTERNFTPARRGLVGDSSGLRRRDRRDACSRDRTGRYVIEHGNAVGAVAMSPRAGLSSPVSRRTGWSCQTVGAAIAIRSVPRPQTTAARTDGVPQRPSSRPSTRSVRARRQIGARQVDRQRRQDLDLCRAISSASARSPSRRPASGFRVPRCSRAATSRGP